MSSEASAVGEVAIEARGLGKVYQLYAQPQDRLRQMFWPGRRKFYREFVAVRDVDLTVHRGECIGVVGRNGSGKSTLLKMICGTLEKSCGALAVHGRVAPMLALGAGFSPEFTGRENVLLNATVLGLSRAEIRSRMQSIIDFADIGEFFDQPVKCYSSGMYSRLAFAVAISVDPEILVIDEVLAVGDEAFTRKCFARIDEIKRRGATVFFASHSPNLVIELCDRAILMDEGECLLTADPKTVLSRYHQLLYAEPAAAPALREEIRALGQGGAAPTSAGRAAGRSANASAAPVDYGRFDPSLVPESTVEYGRGTARIENVRLLDPDGRPVNVLRHGVEYTFAYDVEFLEKTFMVRFGMLSKLVSGFELAGQASHANGSAIAEVEPGARARVEFGFRALLVPGTYFMNAGVLALHDGEERYLHRVVDALMFRIVPEEGSRITGHADLSGAVAPRVRFDAGPRG